MKELIQEIEKLRIKMKECEYKYDDYSKYIGRAISIYEKKIEVVENNEELLTYLGILYLYNREDEKSLDYFKKAFSLKSNIQTITNLAYFLLYEGDFENGHFKESPPKAIKILKEIVDDDCNSYRPYSLIAECFFELKKYCEMEKYLRKSIKIEKNYKNVYNLSVALFIQKKYKESLQYLSILKENENINKSLCIYLNMAICSLFINEKSSVKKYLKYIEDNDEDDEISVLEIAKLYLLIEDYENAIRNYLKAEDYYYSVDWISENLYCYHKLRNKENFNILFNKFIEEKESEIKENINDKEFDIKYERELQNSINELKKIKNDILCDTYKLNDNFEMYIEKDCYLFGCIQHNNK